MDRIPFNIVRDLGAEVDHVREAIEGSQLSSGGPFSERCARALEELTGAALAVLVHSATAALEMTALLAELEPGDEVIMPSFTFSSTATAYALRGATPVFVDIRPDTQNLDETKVEDAVTERTRAMVAVHYAGVPCEMDALGAIARRHGLLLFEDAAQALFSRFRGTPAGTLGDGAAISFHETKNVVAGEGGALLVPERWAERALVLRDKGTNRSRFLRGEVDKYSWVDLGSSYGLSELNAAYLWGQLEVAERIQEDRHRVWDAYHEALAPLEGRGLLTRPFVPDDVDHNAHLYYVLVADLDERTALIEELGRREVHAVFHYVPLHSSPAGRRYGRTHGELPVTDSTADRLVRLPLWYGMPTEAIERVVDGVAAVVERRVRA